MKDDWNQHWGEVASFWRSNPANVYRRALLMDLLELDRAPAPLRLLDIGTGLGDFVYDVSRRRPDAQITGLELSQVGVDSARKKVPGGLFLKRDLAVDGEPPEEARNWATHANCSEVLEHVDDPVGFLRNASRFMADGCVLAFTVPGGPMSAYDRHIGHRRHYTAESARQLLEAADFEPIETFGAGFPFFNVYRLAVIARGRKLVGDIDGGAEGTMMGVAGVAMSVLNVLFRLNLDRSPWGWQIAGLARKRAR